MVPSKLGIAVVDFVISLLTFSLASHPFHTMFRRDLAVVWNARLIVNYTSRVTRTTWVCKVVETLDPRWGTGVLYMPRTCTKIVCGYW